MSASASRSCAEKERRFTIRGRLVGHRDVALEELSEMVPPAYTELIGHQLMQHLQAAAA